MDLLEAIDNQNHIRLDENKEIMIDKDFIKLFGSLLCKYILDNNYEQLEYVLNNYHNIVNECYLCRYGKNIHIMDYICECGNLDILQLFLKHNIISTDNMLFYAIKGKKCDMIVWLLENNICYIQEINDMGGSPLSYACYISDLYIVELLLNYNAIVDRRCLLNAIYCNNIEIVKLLIDNGYQITIKTFDTIIHCGKGCHLDCFKLIIESCNNFNEIAHTIMTTDRINNLWTLCWNDNNGKRTNVEVYIKLILQYVTDQDILDRAYYRAITNDNNIVRTLHSHGANLDGLEDWIRSNILNKS
jgi:hypothetical protein